MSKHYNAERARLAGETTIGSAPQPVQQAIKGLIRLSVIERTTNRSHYRVQHEMGAKLLETLGIEPDIRSAAQGNHSGDPLVRVSNMVNTVEQSIVDLRRLTRAVEATAIEEGWLVSESRRSMRRYNPRWVGELPPLPRLVPPQSLRI